MLFSKPIADLTYEDVEEFCRRFHEGLRVEYKSTFDSNVKRKIPRVVSSFANSYGGILIVGINATNGVPQEPFEGIEFDDREPRLTVENICRDGIFPEATVFQNLVPSKISGRAFLVIQVNESSKAPHAIENSTQVYVRTGDSANPTSLAEMALVERLLLRRQDVLGRWNQFYEESGRLAEKIGLTGDRPLLELRIGPQYPTEILAPREEIYGFLKNFQMQNSIGFGQNTTLRHPTGALLSRKDDRAKYLNIGEFGTIHYIEPLSATTYARMIGTVPQPGQGETRVYAFWWVTKPILRILNVAAFFMSANSVTCDLRIEATLSNVSGLPFILGRNMFQMEHSQSLTGRLPASASCSSQLLGKSLQPVTVELLYQLIWPIGDEDPRTRDEIGEVVSKESESARVRY
jgi:Putative DNA-binding domain